MNRTDILDSIENERSRQDVKWGGEFEDRHHSYWLTILTEEIGEIAQAILTGYNENLQEELIQSAAVIVSWLEFFDDAVEGDK